MLRWHDEDSRLESFPPFDSGFNELALEYSNCLIHIFWCAWRDLNPQHPVSKTGASTNWTTRAILLLKILFLYFVTPITFRSHGHAHLYMVQDPNQEVP